MDLSFASAFASLCSTVALLRRRCDCAPCLHDNFMSTDRSETPTLVRASERAQQRSRERETPSLNTTAARGGNILVERIANRLSARPPISSSDHSTVEDLIDHKHSPYLISARLAQVSHPPTRLTHTDERIVRTQFQPYQ